MAANRRYNRVLRPQLLRQVCTELDRVASFPSEQRRALRAKVELVDFVLEDVPAETPSAVAQAVVRALRDGLDPEWVEPGGIAGPDRLAVGLTRLVRGLKRIDEEALALRRQTGLDQRPEPAKLELPTAELVRELIIRLKTDDELAGLGKLARELMAVVHLPRRMGDPEELPLGGVSDITNRGELDRLLASELVHDDLTLAVRIAANEALYIRRETSPGQPLVARALLVDAGIRMWGIPRVYASAVALAMAATSDPNTDVLTYRSAGDAMVPINLTSRAGLVEHLQVLELAPHPLASLRVLLNMLDRRDTAVDCVLITCREVLADRQFQQGLALLADVGLFLATVSGAGDFRLERVGSHSRKLLREAHLDLDKLLTSRKRPTTRLVDQTGTDDLPLILSVDPFPLRLPHHDFRPSSTWSVEGHGHFAVTSDWRLLHKDVERLGWRQIAEQIPGRSVLWASPVPHGGRVWAVVGNVDAGRQYLITISLETWRCEITALETRRGCNAPVGQHNGLLFVPYGQVPYLREVDCINLTTGRIANRLHCRDLCLCPGQTRYLRHQDFDSGRERNTAACRCLTSDGRGGSFEKVTDARGGKLPALIALFDRVGHEGPLGLLPNGDLYNTATGQRICLDTPIPSEAGSYCVTGIARDGSGLVLHCRTGEAERTFLLFFDNRTGAWVRTVRTTASSGRAHDADYWLGRMSQQRYRLDDGFHMRRKFHGIFFDENHFLALVSRSKTCWHMAPSPIWAGNLLLQRKWEPIECRGLREFEKVHGMPKKSYHLKVAKWPDGSRAYLDSRGLLHLISSDPKLPQLALVLTQSGRTAGWCSDGRVWGDPYFTGKASTVDEPAVLRDILILFARRVTW